MRVTPSNSCPEQPTLSGPLVEACATTDDVIPGAVESLTITSVNHEAILATWSPPSNYQRSGLEYMITVTAPGSTDVMETVVDHGYYYLDGLTTGKVYTVSVIARSGAGDGVATMADGTTLPGAPDPPESPQLVANDDNTFTLSWDPVDGVEEFAAVLRCNEQAPVTKSTTNSATLVVFTLSSPEPNFAWCTAQVQSKNDVGLGEFSELVSVAIPSSAPSKPHCYLVDDQGSAVFISFDVTHPFSLDSLSLHYKLVADFEAANDVVEEMVPFNGSNVLMLKVMRNTRYDFQLRLCNDHGCSDHCGELTNFTTSSVSGCSSSHTHTHSLTHTHTHTHACTHTHTKLHTHTHLHNVYTLTLTYTHLLTHSLPLQTPPRPPSKITVSDLTHISATLSWNIPDFENATSISYLLQVTSSGAGTGTHTIPGVVTSLSLPGLDPETIYAMAIQVRDMVTNTDGLFGPAVVFTTVTGAPSPPTALEAKWVSSRRELSVTWGVPNVTNGTIRSYELTYSGNAKRACGNLGDKIVTQNFTSQARSFVTKEAENIIDMKSFVVCVRAHTNQPGEWARYSELDVNIEGVTGQESDSGGNCNGLIAVAVVAGLAVISTVVAAAVLFVVVRRHHSNQVTDRQSRASSSEDQLGVGGGGNMTQHERNSPSRGSNDTGFDEQQRPPFNSLQSTDSIGSTKHLLVNGR